MSKKISDLNFEIKIQDKVKNFHINRIMLYHARENTLGRQTHYKVNTISGEITEYDEGGYLEINDTEPGIPLEIVKTPDIDTKTDFTKIKISEQLTKDQQDNLKELIDKHKQSVSNIPGKTTLVVHDIILKRNRPIRVNHMAYHMHAGRS